MIEKLKPLIPYLAAIGFFIVITFIYFSPVLQGRALEQMDNTKAIGMSQELVEHEKETGNRAQWTNSMFGGMPAYQIRADASANLFYHFNRYTRLGMPFTTVAIVFLYLIGFFVLMRSMGFNPWLSVIGSVAFAFGSYNFIIIIAGHITKAYAIALMAPVLGGILYTYNRNKWAGALFTTFALGAEIAYNHVQITYYLALLVLILVLDKFSRSIANNTIQDFLQRTGLLVIAALLAIIPNLTNLWTTYEYGQESIRGRSALTEEVSDEKRRGLDPDYAFAWSYGKLETFTLLIPNFKGGASEPIGQNPELTDGLASRIRDFLNARGVNYGQHQNEFIGQLANEISQQSQYWGGKPFTSGPVYVGSIICFLFILALFFYKGKEKWWLLAGTILSILLAWGKNLEWFNMLMFNHFPLYDKFRTVEMALVIASVTMPILALLGLKQIVEKPELIRQKSNYFLAALGLTGGVALLFYLIPGMLNYLSQQELAAITSQQAANPDQTMIYDLLMQEMQYIRMSMMKADAFRSLLFIALASGSIWFFSGNKFSVKYLLPGLLILVLVDLWGIDRRYINNDNFVPKRETQRFTKSEADKKILEDDDPHYRVFAPYRNPFNDSRTSYHHKSIGGYHGAKLQRYQDVIDRYLQINARMLMGSLQQGGNISDVIDALSQMPAINMLNTKYIVFHPEMDPLQNPYAMGNAWLVDDIKTVSTQLEEINAIDEINLKETAAIHVDFADILQEKTLQPGDGSIELTHYSPEVLKYEASSDGQRLAVFSEIYYPAGWKAFVNGEEVPVLRANYLLRAIFIPEGESTIEFRFEPTSYRYGKMISGMGSIIILLLTGFYFWKRTNGFKSLKNKE